MNTVLSRVSRPLRQYLTRNSLVPKNKLGLASSQLRSMGRELVKAPYSHTYAIGMAQTPQTDRSSAPLAEAGLTDNLIKRDQVGNRRRRRTHAVSRKVGKISLDPKYDIGRGVRRSPSARHPKLCLKPFPMNPKGGREKVHRNLHACTL